MLTLVLGVGLFSLLPRISIRTCMPCHVAACRLVANWGGLAEDLGPTSSSSLAHHAALVWTVVRAEWLGSLDGRNGRFKKRTRACRNSRGIKRDKLNGTSRAEFAAFRRFSLIFADFRFSWGIYSTSGAQIFAENRRKPQIFAETRLSHLVCPF